MRASLIFVISLPLLCTGCHRSASAHVRGSAGDQPGEEPIMQSYAQALTVDATQHDLAPDDLTSLHQQKGVGLALQVTGRQFRAGQNIPLVVVYEDIAAVVPISSSNCSGFSIAIEDVDQGKTDVGQINPCQSLSELSQNSVALVKGNRRFLHTSLFGVRQELTHPGKYLIRATWQSYHPHEGGFRPTDSYAVVHSNVIPIVITR